MKKTGFVLCLFLMMGLMSNAQNPILMRMAGEDIHLSEFLGYFHQTKGFAKTDRSAYLRHFVQYKLKVADAKERQLDTLPDFKHQCEFLQARILKDYFMNHQLTDSYCRQWIEEQNQRQAQSAWVKINLYTYRLSQHASSQTESNAVGIMDELYERLSLENPLKYDGLLWAREHAVVCEQETDQWIPLNSLLKEKIEQLSTMDVNECSKPFYSPLGIHIVCLIDHKKILTSEDVKSQVEQIVDRQGLESPLLNLVAYNEWMNDKTSLPDEVKQRMDQIYQGLLATFWDYSFIPSEQDKVSPEELEAYFQKHKDHYRWEYPHYKGAVIHCLNKKAASKIKKRLKKLPMSFWENTLKDMQEENSQYRNESDCGLFQIGKNCYVDRLAFKCGEFQTREDLPYTFLIGKKLKKGPEKYSDILQKVTSDYKLQRENDYFSQLFARFNVEINEDVLKTVNSCGNK